jgi:hypothetical protein
MHDEGPNLAPDDLMKITARTHVMVADDDEVALEHAVAGLIGGGSGLARPGEASLAHATIRKCS